MTPSSLTPPRFHHIHLRASDPSHAVDFYTHLFASATAGEWGGLPAVVSPNNVMILFEQDDDIRTGPQSALWHFGWQVTDSRATTADFLSRDEGLSRPLYTGIDDATVPISSDTWFKTGETLGVTLERLNELCAADESVPGGAGFAYFQGPDDALFEIIGDMADERIDHVHMWHEDPLCAQIWYETHFLVPPRKKFGPVQVPVEDCKVPRTTDRTFPALNAEGMFRAPAAGVEVGDINLTWYPNQGDTPLQSSLGQLMDHIAFSVTDLDAWITKLRGDGVTFLSDEYPLADTRAVMVEGPSREALEIVETPLPPPLSRGQA